MRNDSSPRTRTAATRHAVNDLAPPIPAGESSADAGNRGLLCCGPIFSARRRPGRSCARISAQRVQGGLSLLREALLRLAENRLVTGNRPARLSGVVGIGARHQRHRDGAQGNRGAGAAALDRPWRRRLGSEHRRGAPQADATRESGKNVSEDVWESRHRDFHRTLVSACQSKSLLHLHGLLTDQFDRYRRLSAKSRLPNAPRLLIHQRIPTPC